MNVTVSWTLNATSEQVVKYEIFRSVPGGSLSKIGEVAGSENQFVDPSVPTGVYNYVVRATNLAGTSPNSSVASTPSAPSTPSGVSVVTSA